MVIASLLMLTAGSRLSAPSRAEVEALAREYGMVYEDEILVFSESAKPNSPDPVIEQAEQETELIHVSIPKGISAERIAELLLEKGIIDDKMEFIDRVLQREVSIKLEAGEHYFAPALTIDEIIDQLLLPGGGQQSD
ncbi:MAG: endolytic transglycosylase MltG [Clostridia bacterium]|nr:endolytic transglycosylase MltG [Clostridia bacterium]